MNALAKMMRHKRFNLKFPDEVRFTLETNLGTRLELKLLNVSLSGLGAETNTALKPNEVLEPSTIIPAAKITYGKSEFSLGRLIVRQVHTNGEKTYFGFSTVDFRVPIDGPLSQFLDLDLDGKSSPYEFEFNPDKFSLRSFNDGSHSNVDIFMKTEQFDIFLKEWRRLPIFQFHNIRSASKGGRVKLRQNRKGNRNDYLVMGSNDYLGLGASPEVCEAAKKAIDEYGFGSTGSPLTTGLTDLHEELCDYVASLFKCEKAILFNSGYAANVGAINSLMTAQDLIVADFLSHASIQDAMQMSLATSRFFKHNDINHLNKILKDNRESSSGALVITEGVFSMDGDVPPLTEIVKSARQYNARVFLDEAHSFGVVGPTGLGCWEKFPNAKVDIIMGTFSKIGGGIGGFIAANEEVVNWMKFYGRSHMFSVSIPPSTAAAALEALKQFRARPELVKNLQENIKHFVKGLRELGCEIDPHHESAVIPVIIGDEKKLGIMNAVLRENGVYVIPITYPAVSRKNCRFRFTMMATHSISDLDYVLATLERAMEKANFSFQVPKEEMKSAA